jgi:hypothetical protein
VIRTFYTLYHLLKIVVKGLDRHLDCVRRRKVLRCVERRRWDLTGSQGFAPRVAAARQSTPEDQGTQIS